jgi:hypothetical protein
MSWRRQRSAVFAPASPSLRIPMICSSVNRDRFMIRSLYEVRTLTQTGRALQGRVTIKNVAAMAQTPAARLPSIFISESPWKRPRRSSRQMDLRILMLMEASILGFNRE